MAFVDDRLPVNIERGATGGPTFNTTIFATKSGYEQRNINWSAQRCEYNVGYGIQSAADAAAIIKFFYARRGRAYAFRFKDWSDFKITGPQTIGTGDGANKNFQIYKRYTSGGVSFDRTIWAPVNGTVQVYKAGVLQVSGYTVNYATGVISFTAAPAGAAVIAVACEFDVPVRFDTDQLNVQPSTYLGDEATPASIPNIPLVEVRQ